MKLTEDYKAMVARLNENLRSKPYRITEMIKQIELFHQMLYKINMVDTGRTIIKPSTDKSQPDQLVYKDPYTRENVAKINLLKCRAIDVPDMFEVLEYEDIEWDNNKWRLLLRANYLKYHGVVENRLVELERQIRANGTFAGEVAKEVRNGKVIVEFKTRTIADVEDQFKILFLGKIR